MNAKEIKSHLKDAREAIRVRDFDGASGHCKAILDKDDTNYNALVFLGVAAEGLEKFDDALNAYRKATSECPDQILAWQGLASMLDKHPKLMILKEKVTLYEKLQSFTKGAEGKRISYLHKLVDLYKEAGFENKAYETLVELLDLEKEGDGRVSACRAMVDLLMKKDLSKDGNKSEKYHCCLDELLNIPDLNTDEADTYSRLSLFSESKASNTHSWVELRGRFPHTVSPLEFGLRTQMELMIGTDGNMKHCLDMVQSLGKDLEDLSPENELVKTAHGVMALYQNNYTQAKDCLLNGKIISTSFFLCETYLKLHDFSKCLDVCSAGVAMCAEPRSLISGNVQRVEDMFKLILAEVHRQLGSDRDREASLKIIEELESRGHSKASVIKCHLYLDQNRIDDAKNCLQNMGEVGIEAKMVNALIQMIEKQYNQALTTLQDILVEDPDHALATLQKGVCLWELRNSPDLEDVKQQCFTSLLKAAKLDPYNYESFLYLGYFYDQIQKDAVKASRCYRKAYDLNPDSEDAGCCFVDSLLDKGDQTQAVDVLKAVTTRAPAGKAKWAWLRLGLYQMKHEDPSTAIMSLQAALRADPKDNHVWECLSEAYLHRGSLTAALKAFTKASELNPNSTYCLYQIANIKQTLGLLPEAVKEYRHVLEKEHNYVAALKGLGESVILLARQNLQQCLDGVAQDNMEEAISVLTKAASTRPDFSCLWKLMGDACTLAFCLASNSYRVPSKLWDKGLDRDTMTNVTKAQLLQIGGRCYRQAVKIMPENASLWHNLGINLYRQCCVEHRGVNELLAGAAKELLQRAKKALENALKLERKNWRHWNALGVLACFKGDPKLAFAQHCFIKSAECEASNVVAWSNLGVLYLSQGEIGLAHDTFKVAQRLDPTYMVGWLGQAFIAESVGHEEALDLFRHTTELGSHLESELGYGHHVLSMLKDKSKQDTGLFQYCIHRMSAIPAASDALIKYTARVQTDPVAYNMLGLILEYQNLVQPAVDAFAKALNILNGSGNTAMENQVRMNYARTLCTLGVYKESLEQFQQIESELTLDHLLIFALTAYKEGNYIDSYKLYKAALDQVPDDDNESLKSQVYAALAMVAFKVDDLDEAKTQLFSGFQTESPSLHGLLAMCALGLHQRDMTLAGAALDELSKRPDGKDVVDKIALVTLYKHMLEGSVPDGEAFVRDMIQTHPQSAKKLWMMLASFLLNQSSNRSKDALDVIMTVNKEGGAHNVTAVVIRTLAELQAGMHNRHSHQNALKSAQRAFHNNPGAASTTAALACALHADGVLRKSCKDDDQSYFFDMEKAFLQVLGTIDTKTHKPELLTWYAKQHVVNCIEMGDETTAKETLHVLEEDGNAVEFVDAVKLFLYCTPIDEWSKKETVFAIQIVCSIMADEYSEFSAVDEILKRIVEKPQGNQENLPMSQLLELWTHTAYKGIQKKATKAKELDHLYCEGLSAATEREIKSPFLSVIQGIRRFKNDKKDAKHYFATALDLSAGRANTENCKCLARQGLIALMWDSTKQSDQDLIQALVEDAKSENDVATVQLHTNLTKA